MSSCASEGGRLHGLGRAQHLFKTCETQDKGRYLRVLLLNVYKALQMRARAGKEIRVKKQGVSGEQGAAEEGLEEDAQKDCLPKHARCLSITYPAIPLQIC